MYQPLWAISPPPHRLIALSWAHSIAAAVCKHLQIRAPPHWNWNTKTPAVTKTNAPNRHNLPQSRCYCQTPNYEKINSALHGVSPWFSNLTIYDISRHVNIVYLPLLCNPSFNCCFFWTENWRCLTESVANNTLSEPNWFWTGRKVGKLLKL